MQFSKILVAAAAFALATAQTVKFTNTDFAGITVGKSFNITWSGATSDITLKLKNGPANAQLLVETIGSGLTGTSYLWTPESSIVDGIYNLEIDHGSDLPNYSIQFTISGGLLSSSSTAASTSASSTVTSSAASTTQNSTSSVSSATNSSASSKPPSSTTKPSSSSTASSTATTSVPASNNAIQYASPFALILASLLAIAVLN